MKNQIFKSFWLILLCLLAPLTRAAEPVSRAWILNPASSQPASLARIRPEVHAVITTDKYVEIRSAGLSLYDLGVFQMPNDHIERIRQLRFRIPRFPAPASGLHTGARSDVWGVFVNGVPIYNLFESTSYQGQNLWHFDPLAQSDDGSQVTNGYARNASHQLNLGMLPNVMADGTRHSPLLGFALDGYPVYGPWGFAQADGTGGLRRMRSSYRLRRIARRTSWANGTALTPGQYGPLVSDEYPLGAFIEDYEYAAVTGDLDEFNGRFAVTPEYPQGTYAYFLSTDEQGRLAFPYLLTGRYYGQVTAEELQGAFFDEALPMNVGQVANLPYTCSPIISFTESPLTLNVHGRQLAANEPLRFSFVVNNHEQSLRHLEYVHERPLHLLVISEDLSEFAHIHPMLVAGNHYEVTHTFVHGGRYRLYADYTAPGSAQRIARFTLDVKDKPRMPATLTSDATWQHTQNDLRINISAEQPLSAQAEIPLALSIRNVATNQPISDLEPFLGAWAHFVIVDEKHENFIHAHPLDNAPANVVHTHNEVALGPPPTEIRTLVSFPRPGIYRLWAQFQRHGEVITQPFTLCVNAPLKTETKQSAIPADAIRLNVSASGFAPARLNLPANRPVKLALQRDQLPNCANRIVFPSLGVSYELPLGQIVIIELPALKAGELDFSCGMGMYKGLLVVQ